MQNRLHADDPELPGVISLCEEHDITLLGYSPLGGTPESAAAWSRSTELSRIADARRLSAQQVVLAYWLARSPCIVSLVGARRPASIRASLKAGRVLLEPAEVQACAAALRRQDTPGVPTTKK